LVLMCVSRIWGTHEGPKTESAIPSAKREGTA
jgi:hypothetical protein